MFMQPVTAEMAVFHVETSDGTEPVPAWLVGTEPSADDLRDYVEGTIILDADGAPEMAREEGFYARFSAPGYMDCTTWDGPHETADAALDALAEAHEVCRTCFEACWDGPEPCPEPSPE